MAAVMLATDLAGGGVIRRFPIWAKARELKAWARSLASEHKASKTAMVAALKFSEEIVEGSLKVAGEGGEGADIVAKVIVNGAEQTLKREVRVFGGDLTKSGGKNFSEYIREKGDQVAGAQIKQIFVQIRDNVKSVQNWEQIVKERAEVAMKELGDVTVIVVDKAGKQVFP